MTFAIFPVDFADLAADAYPLQAMLDAKVKAAVAAQSNWLDATLTKLLADGLTPDAIKLEYYPDHRVRIVLNGVPHAEHSIKFTGSEEFHPR